MAEVQPIRSPGTFIAKTPSEIIPISPEAQEAFEQAMIALDGMVRGADKHMGNIIRVAGELAITGNEE